MARYTSTFIFAKKTFDDEFHALDQQIAAAARAIPGYLGEESWENPSTGLVSNVYHWASLEALQTLMRHPTHLLAKAGHTKWLDGYRVVIAEVQREYGIPGLGLVAAAPALDELQDLRKGRPADAVPAPRRVGRTSAWDLGKEDKDDQPPPAC